MFERSLLEAAPTHRWTTIVSITLQCTLAAALLTVPLLHPAGLIFRSEAPKLFLPLRPAPIPLPKVTTTTSPTAAAASASAAAPSGHRFTFTHPGPQAADDAPKLSPIGGMGSGDPASVGINTAAGTGDHPAISVIPTKPVGPVRVSSGVSAGLLLAPIKPVYPRMAIETRTEGTVVVEAIISKSGAIESAHATSGPPLLREAAIDAIRAARYSPYLLNGTPTEVQTTITVTFRLAS